MAIFKSQLSTSSDAYTQNRAGMLAIIDKTCQFEQRAFDASAKAKPCFDKRGQILPREPSFDGVVVEISVKQGQQMKPKKLMVEMNSVEA